MHQGGQVYRTILEAASFVVLVVLNVDMGLGCLLYPYVSRRFLVVISTSPVPVPWYENSSTEYYIEVTVSWIRREQG